MVPFALDSVRLTGIRVQCLGSETYLCLWDKRAAIPATAIRLCRPSLLQHVQPAPADMILPYINCCILGPHQLPAQLTI